MSSIKLTEVSIQKIRLPEKGQKEIADRVVPGLYLRVTSAGTKTWYYRYRFAGKDRRMSLGRYPAIGLKIARETTREAIRTLEKGLDPALEKKLDERQRGLDYEATFSKLCQKFLCEHEQGVAHYNGVIGAEPAHRSWKQTKQVLEKNVIPLIGDLPLSEIRKRDIQSLLAPITLRAPYQSNKTLAMIRKIYNWALNEDLVEASPCMGLKKPHKPVARNRPLSDDEIHSFWQACLKLGYPYGDAFRMMLITGQRRTEVGAMTLNEIDFTHSEWVLSPERTKANRRHVVPVTSLGIDVLENVPSTCGTHLFSSSFGANPISNYGDAKLELVQMTQLENFRLHDLRDTVGTVMRERLEISSDVIGQVLNHAPEGVTQKHYCPSHSPKDKRKALIKWDRYLDNLVHETKADNIIQFPGVG